MILPLLSFVTEQLVVRTSTKNRFDHCLSYALAKLFFSSCWIFICFLSLFPRRRQPNFFLLYFCFPCPCRSSSLNSFSLSHKHLTPSHPFLPQPTKTLKNQKLFLHSNHQQWQEPVAESPPLSTEPLLLTLNFRRKGVHAWHLHQHYLRHCQLQRHLQEV